jgi:hypothetical protein
VTAVDDTFEPPAKVLDFVRSSYSFADYCLDDMAEIVRCTVYSATWQKLVQEAGMRTARDLFGAFVRKVIEHEAGRLESEAERAELAAQGDRAHAHALRQDLDFRGAAPY